MDEAEGGGGEGGEHGRVGGDVLGDAFAADQARAEELEGVAPVGFGAGRAGRGAAVPAGFVDDPVRQARGGHRGDDFTGGGVDAVDLPGKPYGVGASGGGPDVIQPGGVGVRVERAGGDVLAVAFRPVAIAGAGVRAGGGVQVGGAGVRPRARTFVGSGDESQHRAGIGHERLPVIGVPLMVVTGGGVVPSRW